MALLLLQMRAPLEVKAQSYLDSLPKEKREVSGWWCWCWCWCWRWWCC